MSSVLNCSSNCVSIINIQTQKITKGQKHLVDGHTDLPSNIGLEVTHAKWHLNPSCQLMWPMTSSKQTN